MVDVNAELGLNGECDFLLSSVPLDFEIKVPVFALRETKGPEIESCLPQCAAQMVAAQLFNERDRNSIPAVYGCVTTGVVWRFLKLEGNNLIIDVDVYCLDNVPRILGVLQTIVNLYQFFMKPRRIRSPLAPLNKGGTRSRSKSPFLRGI